MDTAHLRASGWSEEEIAHAMRTFAAAEERKHPTIRIIEGGVLALLFVLIAVGIVAAALRLLPLFSLISPYIAAPITLILGLCIGLLLVHALWDLRPGRVSHTVGIGVVGLICVGTILVAFGTVSRRLLAIGVENVSVWFVTVPLIIGVLVPYILTWRDHESA